MLSLAKYKGKYDKIVFFSQIVSPEIIWWRDNVLSSSAPIIRNNPDIVINTDACSYGWGATREGDSTGGLFDTDEIDLHINVSENKAVLFGLKSLCDTNNTYILVRSDNTELYY